MSEHDGQGCCCGCSSRGLSGVSRRGFLAAGALAAALPAVGVLGAEAGRTAPTAYPAAVAGPARVQL